ncbi:MAG: hypothetical protein LJE67_07010, partial [Salaquimonas sp.]|nr:hypothetical protein [Salaquimonas sp.]
REAARRSPRLAELFGDRTPRSLTDRTFFDIRVTEVLRGQAPDMLTVTLGNSKQLAEKVAMARGPYLIALRQRILMLRVPNGVILREPVPGYLTVLDSTCWGGFLFEASSERAALVRKLLKSGAE